MLVVLSLWHTTRSQELSPFLPFKDVLENLESQLNISFSYADENVNDVIIQPPQDGLSLQETLDYLSSKTGLIFTIIDDRSIAINKPDTTISKICAFVFSSESQLPMPDVSIKYGSNITYTDRNGTFTLEEINRKSLLVVKYIGYETLYLEAGSFSGNGCDTLWMTEMANLMDEIIVNNFIIEGIDKKIDGSLLINSSNLKILPGLIESDVLQSVQAFPGIISVNETISDINVRGGTSDQNLLLWDGIRIYQSGHFFGLISAINPYLTDRVTVIKNGTTSYHGDAVSSTIDIRSDDVLRSTLTGGAGINMINADVFAKIPLSDRVALQFSARRSISDLLKTPTYKQYFDRAFHDTDITNVGNGVDSVTKTNEIFRFYDAGIRLLYDISARDKLRVNFLHVDNGISYSEILGSQNTETTRDSGLDQSSTLGGINYSRIWNENLSTSALVFYSYYNINAVNHDIAIDQKLIQENEIKDSGLKLNLNYSFSELIDLFAGYQFYETGISNLDEINQPPFRRLIKKVMRNHVLFTELNLRSRSRGTHARLGLRSNYYSNLSKVLVEPRFSLNQRLTDNFSLELAGEFKNQAATQVVDFQYDFLGVEKRRWVLSDEKDIPVIRSKQVSAAVNYNQKNLLISLEAFIKQVEGITSASQGFQNQFQYMPGTGRYDVDGIEFLINQKFNRLSLWSSYTLAENTYFFDDFDPSSFPNNLDIRHSATAGAALTLKKLLLSAGMNWRTGKPVTLPDEDIPVISGDINFQAPNETPLDNYFRLDLSANYKFKIGKRMGAELGASIWNLTDRRNIMNEYYRINENGDMEAVRQYSLGFTPNFVFRISF